MNLATAKGGIMRHCEIITMIPPAEIGGQGRLEDLNRAIKAAKCPANRRSPRTSTRSTR